MALGIGLIGLPNAGKSTTFNALTQSQQAAVANYPFCTIEPNMAIVPVPDPRLDVLAAIIQPPRVVPSTVEFFDIAGLVRGAHKGEGLGNQFLAAIRETAALVHVVRCFEDDNVAHVTGKIDPAGDVEIVKTELMLADLQTLERRLEKLEKQARGDRTLAPLLEMAIALKTHLEQGHPVSTFTQREQEAYSILDRELRFLTGKPVIYAANVDEKALSGGSALIEAVRRTAEADGAVAVVLCAKLEEELAALSAEERREFLKDLGIAQSGLEQIIRLGYQALNLISFFSHNEKELRSWTIQRGWKAPQAAGVIHTDFEKHFIRAEVVSYSDFIRYRTEAEARAAGHLRLEGKDYIVQDGDIIRFRTGA